MAERRRPLPPPRAPRDPLPPVDPVREDVLGLIRARLGQCHGLADLERDRYGRLCIELSLRDGRWEFVRLTVDTTSALVVPSLRAAAASGRLGP